MSRLGSNAAATPIRPFTLPHGKLYLGAAALSLLLSVAAVLGDTVINDDGIVYIHAARAFAEGDWDGGMRHYGWPLFPLLIAGLSKLTGIDATAAAHVWQAVFACLVVTAFIAVCRRLWRDPLVTALAAFVIVFYPELNDWRADIIRDLGFTAFLLTGFYALLRHFEEGGLRWSVAWAVAITVAALFRIEAVVIAALLPLIGLALPGREGRQRLRAVAVPFGCLAALAAIALILSVAAVGADETAGLKKIRQLRVYAGAVTGDLWPRLQARAHELETDVFSGPHDYGMVALVGGSAALLLHKLVTSIALPLLVPVWIGYRRTAGFSRTAVIGLALAGVPAPALYTLNQGFTTGRYVAPIGFALLLLVPPAIAALLRMIRARPKRRGRTAAAVFLILFALYAPMHSLGKFDTSRRYQREAGEWLAAHTRDGDRIYSNEAITAFYSGRVDDPKKMGKAWPRVQRDLPESAADYHYIALEVKARQAAHLQPLLERLGEPVARFGNNRGDAVLIFAGKAPATTP